MKTLAWPHEASQGQRKEGDSVLQDCSKEKEQTHTKGRQCLGGFLPA